MRFSAKFLMILSSILALSGSVHADGAGLPSDFGPVSIEASRRELQSRMQDWSDDREDNKTRRVLACAMASAEGAALLGSPVGAVATLTVLKDLPRYLGGKVDENGPSRPLYLPLNALSRQVVLTEAERGSLERLMAREITDNSDRIRLFIDTEALLMTVSKRLYQQQIDFHVGRTTGFMGFFRFDYEYCAALSLGAERDEQLTQAAYRILAFYNFLEQELKD
jgi:hypothetical protein